MIETAVYTDCLADEAVDGRPGFNFRSLGPGITGTQQQIIQERMLHRVSARWDLDNDPLAHPPTFTYVRDRESALFSRGRSTGRTNSGRRGNQLTQIVAASASSDLSHLRPAQIYGATRWGGQDADSSTSQDWETPPTIDPGFESRELLEWAKQNGQVLDLLPRFLTMLADSARADDGSMITVIVHRDLDQIMRWAALGTLLLDDTSAARLEIGAILDDPFPGGFRLVGMSPDLAAPPATGVHVLDAEQLTATPVEVTVLADRTVAWLRRDEDVEETLQLAAVAQAWATQAGSSLAAAGAELVLGCSTDTSEEKARTALSLVEALVDTDNQDDIDTYEEELSLAMGSAPYSAADEVVRSAVAARLVDNIGLDDLAGLLFRRSLLNAARFPEEVTPWLRELHLDTDATYLNSGQVGQKSDNDDDRQGLAKDLRELLSKDLPDEAILHIVDLVNRFQIMEEALDDSLARAAANYLLAHPEELRRTQGWPQGESIRSKLRRQILDEPIDPAVWRDLQDGVWDELTGWGEQHPDADVKGLRELNAVARLSRILPPAKRAEAIRRQRPAVPATYWDKGLEGLAVEKHPAVWLAWVEGPRATKEFVREVNRAVRRELGRTPSRRELRRWVPLVDALAAGGFKDAEALKVDLMREVDQIGTSRGTLVQRARDEATDFLNRLDIRRGKE